MKKFLLVCVALVVNALVSFAAPVSVERATRMAQNFLSSEGVDVSRWSSVADSPYGSFFIFNFSSGQGDGFILVAADDCVTPVLGFSLQGAFSMEAVPAHVESWLRGYDEEASTKTGSTPHPLWARYEGGGAGPQSTAVAPLLTTTWNQSPRYNNLCPYDYDEYERTIAGCVAIAVAQVMKYWNYPSTGVGSHSYTHSEYGTLSANFGTTTYGWSNMPNALSSSSSTTQINAVATLVYHVGVAVEMNYGTNSSGASLCGDGNIDDVSAENALRTYFKYHPLIHSVGRDDVSDSVFCALLRNELDQGRPVLYSGRDADGGHAFVLDGYNNAGLFHINWGWGSYCDGYYMMGSLNPSSGGSGGTSSSTYNLSNRALIGIMPDSSYGTACTVTALSNNSAYGSVSGGGSYAFGDTVSLLATAQSGCRFVQWSDGGKYNPREFLASGPLTLTAQFEALSGDTLSYCTGNTHISSLGMGSGGTSKWGIKLPASTLTAGHNLQQVQLYVHYAGTYQLAVMTGNTSHIDYLDTLVVSSANAQQWHTITLDTPVAVTGTYNMWIRFTCSDVGYPAAMTYYSGNGDGMLWGNSMSAIDDTWKYNWMIRALFAEDVQPPVLTLQGPQQVTEQETALFTASVSEEASVSWTLPGASPATATGTSVSAVWNTPGNYTVSAVATNAAGSDTATLSVQVLPIDSVDVSFTLVGSDCSLPLNLDPSDSVTTIAGTTLRWRKDESMTLYLHPEGCSEVSLFTIDGEDLLSTLTSSGNAYAATWTPTADAVVEAGCRQREFQLTLVADPDSLGSVTGADLYACGSEASIEAVAAEGSVFMGWNDGSMENPRRVVVTSDTAFTAFFEPITGIDDFQTSPITVQIMPNPAQDLARLRLDGCSGMARITLYDISGRNLQQQQVEMDEGDTAIVPLDVTALPSGIYLLQVQTAAATRMLRLVVQ